MDLPVGKHAVGPALMLAAGGTAVFALGLIRRSKLLSLAGFGAALAGAGLYGRAWFARRGEKIDAAADHIRSELDELDPVARAQVLADVTRSQL